MNDAPHRASVSRNSVLVAVCLAALTLPLNFSAGAVATPAIGQDLGGSPASLTWITNAFMLAFGSLLMAAGALADRYGRRRVFLIGLALFTGFSFALGFAPSVWIIDLLRAGQGVGAAAALAGGTAALAQEFDGHARTRAFGLLGTTFGVGLASGPLLTGLMIETVGWRAIFLAGGLIGLFALILGPPRMRETRDPNAAELDWLGAASFTLTLTLFTVAMIELPVLGSNGIIAFSTGFAFFACSLRLDRNAGGATDAGLIAVPLSAVRGGAAIANRHLRLFRCSSCYHPVAPHRYRATRSNRGGVYHVGTVGSDAGGAYSRDDVGASCFAGHALRHRPADRRLWPRLACRLHCRGWSHDRSAHARHRGGRRPAMGPDGWLVRWRRAGGACGNGDRHIQYRAGRR